MSTVCVSGLGGIVASDWLKSDSLDRMTVSSQSTFLVQFLPKGSLFGAEQVFNIHKALSGDHWEFPYQTYWLTDLLQGFSISCSQMPSLFSLHLSYDKLMLVTRAHIVSHPFPSFGHKQENLFRISISLENSAKAAWVLWVYITGRNLYYFLKEQLIAYKLPILILPPWITTTLMITFFYGFMMYFLTVLGAGAREKFVRTKWMKTTI